MVVREMAKRTAVISDINPHLNKDTMLEREIFQNSRRSIEHLNETITDAIPMDIPAIEAEAALYRIEQDFSTYFQSENRKGEKRHKRSGSLTNQVYDESQFQSQKVGQRNAGYDPIR